jgi:hypothetical protein
VILEPPGDLLQVEHPLGHVHGEVFLPFLYAAILNFDEIYAGAITSSALIAGGRSIIRWPDRTRKIGGRHGGWERV